MSCSYTWTVQLLRRFMKLLQLVYLYFSHQDTRIGKFSFHWSTKAVPWCVSQLWEGLLNYRVLRETLNPKLLIFKGFELVWVFIKLKICRAFFEVVLFIDWKTQQKHYLKLLPILVQMKVCCNWIVFIAYWRMEHVGYPHFPAIAKLTKCYGFLSKGKPKVFQP